MRRGTYIETPALPSGLGLEAAGIVEAVGEGVVGFRAGDAVSIVPPISMARWPAYAELATFPAELVVRHPPELGFGGGRCVDAIPHGVRRPDRYWRRVAGGVRRHHRRPSSQASGRRCDPDRRSRRRDPDCKLARPRSKAQALRDGRAPPHVIASAEEDLQSGLELDRGGRTAFAWCSIAVGGPVFVPLTSAMAHGGILIEYGGLSPGPTPFPLFTVLEQEPGPARLPRARDRFAIRAAALRRRRSSSMGLRTPRVEADHRQNVSVLRRSSRRTGIWSRTRSSARSW